MMILALLAAVGFGLFALGYMLGDRNGYQAGDVEGYARRQDDERADIAKMLDRCRPKPAPATTRSRPYDWSQEQLFTDLPQLDRAATCVALEVV